ncbi:MAG: DNA repair protein RecO [Phycisphaerales bacterium]
MATIQGEAICVRHWDWSETSQTVSLLTREHGLMRCIAKGSKREKAPFSGGVEIATTGHMVAIVKPGSELALLTAWDLLEPMHLMRQDLARYHACMYTIDLIPRLINDHDPHPEIYDALVAALGALGSAEECTGPQGIHALLAWYQWRLLEYTGSRPELMVDVVSGGALDAGAGVYGFDALQGGLTADPGQGGGLSDIWRVRRSTVDLMRRLRTGEEAGELAGQPVGQLRRLGGLLASYIRSMIGSEVASARWVYPDL